MLPYIACRSLWPEVVMRRKKNHQYTLFALPQVHMNVYMSDLWRDSWCSDLNQSCDTWRSWQESRGCNIKLSEGPCVFAGSHSKLAHTWRSASKNILISMLIKHFTPWQQSNLLWHQKQANSISISPWPGIRTATVHTGAAECNSMHVEKQRNSRKALRATYDVLYSTICACRLCTI